MVGFGMKSYLFLGLYQIGTPTTILPTIFRIMELSPNEFGMLFLLNQCSSASYKGGSLPIIYRGIAAINGRK